VEEIFSLPPSIQWVSEIMDFPGKEDPPIS
jgi:hypothetical protein